MSTDLTDLATAADGRALLTAVERRVVDHALRGQRLDLRGQGRDPDHADGADAWDGAPVVRAAVLEVLALGERDDWPLHHRGIHIVGARIVGELVLNFATVAAPLTILDCDFEQAIMMLGTTVKALKLDGTRVPGLFVDGATIDGSVLLRDGFTATGEVNLLNAKIGASLHCDRGSFANRDGPALAAEGVDVAGSVSLRDITATGEVRLPGARIGRELDCNGAILTNGDAPAVVADGVHVAGNISLSDGFTANGEVRLNDATIGGTLTCNQATFTNPDRTALSANRARIAGSAYLSDGFAAHGGVGLVDATIGGSLSCIDGTFANPDGDALAAYRIDVGGSVFLRGRFAATGTVLFVDANVGGVLSCTGASFTKPGDYALVADRIDVAGTVFLSDGFKATGRVHLVGAQIGSELDCTDATFADPNSAAVRGLVDVRGATAAVLIDDVAAWPDGWRGDGFSYGDFGGDASFDVADRLAWLGRQDGAFRSGPYSHLATVYRRRGHPDAARRVLIARERQRTTQWPARQQPVRRLWGALSAYGYRPGRAVGLLAFVVLAGGVVFSSTPMTTLGSGARMAFVPMLYAADLAVPVIDLRQANAYLPEHLWAQWWMWVTIILGWIASLAFVAAITGLFKPDE